jgi:hypothetical protein
VKEWLAITGQSTAIALGPLRIPLGNSALEQSGTSFEMHYKEQMGTFL